MIPVDANEAPGATDEMLSGIAKRLGLTAGRPANTPPEPMGTRETDLADALRSGSADWAAQYFERRIARALPR